MIRSFASKATETLFETGRHRSFGSASSVAFRKLKQLDAVEKLDELRIPPGNRLELLKGNRVGQHSIRVNVSLRPGERGYFEEVRTLVERFAQEMGLASEAPFDYATSIEVSSSVSAVKFTDDYLPFWSYVKSRARPSGRVGFRRHCYG